MAKDIDAYYAQGHQDGRAYAPSMSGADWAAWAEWPSSIRARGAMDSVLSAWPTFAHAYRAGFDAGLQELFRDYMRERMTR